MLVAVKYNGATLQYAALGILNDRQVVLEALEHNGAALQYASPGIWSDREVVLEALKHVQDSAAL